MLRTLLMTIDFPPQRGGVARYLHQFANYFADRIFVIASPHQKQEQNDQEAEYKIERMPILFRYFRPRWIKSIFLLITRQQEYDQVVVSHVLPLGTAACIAKMMTRKPFIVIVHGMDIRLAKRSRIKRWLCKSALTNSKTVVTNSKALKMEIQKDFGLTNVSVSYPCFPDKQIKHIEHEGINLLTVSRLVQRKGHLRVLQALDRIHQNNPDLAFRYHIVGNGPELARIGKEIRQRKLDNYVTFHTSASDKDLQTIYGATDLFVMPVHDHPIDKEGFGMVYMEAAQYGIPSIATNMSGVDEAVVDGQTGLLIPDGDIDALEQALVQLINNKQLRNTLGNAAKKRVTESFSPDAQLKPLKSFL